MSSVSKISLNDALYHVYHNPRGRLRDLTNVIGEENVRLLNGSSFIHIGESSNARTYGLNSLGKQYIEDFGYYLKRENKNNLDKFA